LSLAGVVDGAEPVDELSHALQCATLAKAAGASPELVAAALFHDIGRSPGVRAAFPGLEHEKAGARFVRAYFGEKVAWLVAAHVPAKLYLVASEPAYFRGLSSESRRSLVAQQEAAISPAVLAAHPWWPEALELRRWDDAAKVPGAPTAGVDELLELLEASF
jgi:predicted HD phosphohydrolase